MKVPGTDWVVQTFQVTPQDIVAIRRGYKTAKATAIGVATALPSDSFRDFVTDFPMALTMLGPPIAAALGKKMRLNADPEPHSSEAQVQEALYTPVPEDGKDG